MPLSKANLEQLRVVEEIGDLVDEPLMNDLADWLNNRPPMKTVEVAATLAFLVADALAECCETQKEVCAFAHAYCDYIHQISHVLKTQKDNDTKRH